MPIVENSTRGTVVNIWGKAYIRGADGAWRPLKLGEVVRPGEALLTEQDAIVQMVDGGGAPLPMALSPIDRAISAIEGNRPDAAPAAGLAGGDGGGMQPGLRIDRIVETVTSIDLPTTREGASVARGVATRGDAAGNDGTPAAGALPSVTIDAPALSRDTTPTLAGTTSLPPGATVQLRVTDANGVLQTFDATVQADGRFAADVPTALPDGAYSVVARATLPSGATASANDGGSVDSSAPSITVDVPAQSTDLRPDITGTTDLPAGATVSLTVTGADGAVQSFSATVQADGRYAAEVPQALVPGAVSVVASASDAAGNIGSASDNGLLTVAPPVNTAPVVADGSAGTPENAVLSGTLPAATDADGAVASYQLVAAPAEGSVTVNADGSYVFAPGTAFDDLGVGQSRNVVFGYTATDDDGAVSAPATVTISVTGTNDAPVAQAASAGATEDGPSLTGSVSASDADANASLAFALVGAAPPGLVFNADGTYSFDPSHAAYQALAAGEPMVLTIPYTVTDDQGATSQADLVITVTGTNDAPVAVADLASTSINSALASIDVRANDGDVDHNAVMSVVAVSVDPALGSVGLNPDGTLNFTPAANVTGAVAIGYTLSDGLTTSTGSLTVNVGSNTPPSGSSATVTMAEDSTRSFASADFGFADSDAGQSFHAVRIDALPVDGTLSFGGVPVVVGQVIAAGSLGSLAFTPAANANGAATASFDFSVQDSAGAFAATPSTITFDVTPLPDAAMIGGALGGNASEDGVLGTSGVLTIVDPDAGEAAFQAQSHSAGSYGSFSIDGSGAWNYTLANPSPAVQALAAGQSVTDSFVVASVDGTTQMVTVTITGSNDVPTVSAASAGTGENSVLLGTLPQATDIDAGATITSYQLVASPAQGSVTLNADGTWSFDPGSDFDDLAAGATRQVGFTYTATDNAGGISAPAAVTITVTGTNDAPLAVDDGSALSPALTVAEDSGASAPISVLANDSDADGGALAITAAASPNGSVSITADNRLVFTPAPNFSGATTISYTVSDGQGGSASASVFVEVTPVNDAPTTDDASASGSEDAATRIAVGLSGTDLDGAVAGFRITTLPADGQLYAAAGGGAPLAVGAVVGSTVYFMPQPDFTGDATFQFAAIDDGGLADATPATATVSIAAVDDAPLNSVPGPQAGSEDTSIVFGGANGNAITVGDVDSTTLSTTLSVGTSGTLTLATTAGLAVAGDGTGTVSLSGSAAAINAALDGLVFAPRADVNGALTLDIATSDGVATTNDSVPMMLAPVADIAADSVTTSEDTPVTIDVLGNDTFENGGRSIVAVDGVAITVGGSVAVANGSVMLDAAQQLVFTPAPQYFNTAGTPTTFSYTVDSNGSSETATVSVVVGAVNDGPGALPDVDALSEDSASAIGNVLANDSDPDGGTLVVTGVGFGATTVGAGVALAGSVGTLTLNADGSYSYVPGAAAQALTAGQSVQEQFTVTVGDGQGGSASTTLTITVTGSNDGPVAVADSALAREAGGLANNVAGIDPSGNVLANDSDADSGDTMSVSSFSLGASNGTLGSGLAGAYGTLTMNADGSYGYVVDNANATVQALGVGATLQEQFSYTVRDAAGALSSATLTVTIEGRNDAPAVGIAGASLSEEGLAGANADGTGIPDTTNAASVSGTLAIADVDDANLTVTLSAPATALTSGGQAITWSGSGTGTLVGSVGTSTIVTATIDNAGTWTVQLSGPIDHPSGNGETQAGFGIGVAASDGSSISTSMLAIAVEDDSPVWAGSAMAGAMSNDAGTVLTGNLGVSIGADDGAAAKLAFSGAVDAGGFATATVLKADGTVLGTQNLTYHGTKISYTANADGSLSGMAGATEVFRVAGDAAAGTYRVTMLQTVDAPTTQIGVFGSLSGGNGGVYTLSDGQNAFQLSMQGYVGNTLSTVNTSANSIGVGTGQDIATGERLTIEFNSATGANAPMNTITLTTSGLGNGESLGWAAYDGNGALIGSGSKSGLAGGALTFTLGPADMGGKLFERMDFTAGNNSDYKLRIDSITGQSDALDQRVAFSAVATDADGDATGTAQGFNVLFDSGVALAGGAQADALAGSALAETFNGSGGADLITGGGGNDVMSGGLGADVFKWNLADKGGAGTPANDSLTDFNANSPGAGTPGDVLDLRDLLQGEATSATLDRYLDFVVSGGSTEIRISSAGGFSGGAYAAGAEDQRITLAGVDIRAALGLGGAASDAQIISELISRGKLLTDVPPGS